MKIAVRATAQQIESARRGAYVGVSPRLWARGSVLTSLASMLGRRPRTVLVDRETAVALCEGASVAFHAGRGAEGAEMGELARDLESRLYF